MGTPTEAAGVFKVSTEGFAFVKAVQRLCVLTLHGEGASLWIPTFVIGQQTADLMAGIPFAGTSQVIILKGFALLI